MIETVLSWHPAALWALGTLAYVVVGVPASALWLRFEKAADLSRYADESSALLALLVWPMCVAILLGFLSAVALFAALYYPVRLALWLAGHNK